MLQPMRPSAVSAWRRLLGHSHEIKPFAVLLGGLAVLTVFNCSNRSARVPERITFPAPGQAPADSGPTLDDFVGAEMCAPCHQEQYGAWKRSTHGRAGGSPSWETVIAPFDGTPIQFRDATVIPSVSPAGVYQFTVIQESREEQVFRVDGVIGGGHMAGGGTQGFVSKFPDGTLRFLPFDYISKEGVWFYNTNTRIDKGWVPITKEIALADGGDWPPMRVLGDEPRFANCQGCHGSQIRIRFDLTAKRYQTQFKSLRINCESCHGPGRAHLELARLGRIGETADIGIRGLATLTKDESLQVCFQCHALKDVLKPGYLPGKALEEYYALKFPQLGDRPYFPDGRIRTFAYQQTHLYSDCYLNGSMACVDCHNPHSQGYRDIHGNVLESRFSDGQCLGCHASKAEHTERHTHHPQDSPGSSCIACHMPYLQHPELGHQLRFARSDHSIPIPRPAFDEQLGVENACKQCHSAMSTEALQAQTVAWYGETKPHKAIITDLIRAERLADYRSVGALSLTPDASHPLAQMAGLALLFEKHLQPNMPELEAAIIDSLKALADHDDLDLQALALASLHLAQGEEQALRAFLAERLENLGSSEGALRRRWAVALAFLGDTFRNQGESGKAILCYQKALEIEPDEPTILLSLGVANRDAGNNDRALTHFLKSLELEPSQPLVYVNLGLALEGQSDPAGALAAYRRALEINPSEPLAHFNMGNLFLRDNRNQEAIAAYEQTVKLDPGLARAGYYLARAYILVGEYRKALAAVQQSLQFQPENPGAHQMLRDLQRALANP